MTGSGGGKSEEAQYRLTARFLWLKTTEREAEGLIGWLGPPAKRRTSSPPTAWHREFKRWVKYNVR